MEKKVVIRIFEDDEARKAWDENKSIHIASTSEPEFLQSVPKIPKVVTNLDYPVIGFSCDCKVIEFDVAIKILKEAKNENLKNKFE